MKNIIKKVIISITVLTMIFGLTACGSRGASSETSSKNTLADSQAGNDQAATSESPDKESEAAGATEAVQTITTLKGDVTIPVEPKRIVVAFFQGDFLALGIKPVGTTFNDDAIFQEELGDVTVIDAWGLDPELVMSLKPDLIIWNNPDEYETLSKIAPTLIMDYYSMDYTQRLTFFGQITGKEEKAQELINAFTEKVAESKKKLSEAGKLDQTVILLENQQAGSLRAFGNDYGRGGELIYNELGFNAPERIITEVINAEGVSFIDISYEVLGEYSADYIFSDENIKELADNQVFNSLSAVREGRLIETNSGMFWFSDITSMNAQLEFIVDNILNH
ncbi:ABC transporter substrate-binding protein [Clostridium sp. KNHs205]|jgi:iron complex transport system substrate-binding protein|uniref:ABC transporter substrate-binding protein n=1 Tax=Clostridium sp. KNHs205 TaxID=1449050 RepID=UPI00068B329E|nr:ABC transporter substrate-binding protein [Clostridium sp. KNHs205]